MPQTRALGKYSQFISMNKSIANWNYLFAGIEQGLIQQFASTSSQSYSHSKHRFFQKKKKKRERRKFSTKGLGLVLLRLLKKKKKEHQSKFSIPSKNSGFPKFFKKTKKIQKSKKKKSSLNFSSGTKSYDHFPHSPVMQHQVNCPPSTFIEAWSMSQTRGIRQVCRSLFN